MRAITAAVTFGATDENVAEELHLDFLEAGTAAFFALALAGIETEGTRFQAALFGEDGIGEEFAEVIEGADVNGRVAAGSAANRGLIDHHNAAELVRAGDATESFRR